MKKYLILFSLIFFLTGCSDPNRDFTKECKQVTELSGYKEEVITIVNYNHEDEVTKVVIEKNYTINAKATMDSIKESTESYNNGLQNSKGVKFQTEGDDVNYTVTYTLEPQIMSENDLQKFNIKTNSVKYFNALKKNNVKCS